MLLCDAVILNLHQIFKRKKADVTGHAEPGQDFDLNSFQETLEFFRRYPERLRETGEFDRLQEQFESLQDTGDAVGILLQSSIFEDMPPVAWRASKCDKVARDALDAAFGAKRAGVPAKAALPYLNFAVRHAERDEQGKSWVLAQAFLCFVSSCLELQEFTAALVALDFVQEFRPDATDSKEIDFLRSWCHLKLRNLDQGMLHFEEFRKKECESSGPLEASQKPELKLLKTLIEETAKTSPPTHETRRAKIERLSVTRPSTQLLDASCAISLGHSEDRGRFITATRNIEPGEVLVSEKPGAVCVRPKSWTEWCNNCLQRTFVPWPCIHCSMVVFCSSECYAESWNAQKHLLECRMISNLADYSLTENLLLAVKLVLSFGVYDIWKSKDAILLAERQSAVLPMEPFDTSNYLAYTALPDHRKLCSKQEYFMNALMTAYVLHVLDNAEVFDYCSHDDERKLEVMKFVGKQILYHTTAMKNNRLALSETLVTFRDNSAAPMFTYRQFGQAAVATVNLFNHACTYCAVWDYVDTGHIVVRAVVPISRGEEVTICYTCNFASDKRSVRAAKLGFQFNFSCKCRACVNDWPTGEALLRTQSSFRCPKCKRGISFGICTDCGFDINPYVREMIDAAREFDLVYARLGSRGDLGSALPVLYKQMKLVNLLYEPNTTAHVCTADAIKKAFARDGRIFFAESAGGGGPAGNNNNNNGADDDGNVTSSLGRLSQETKRLKPRVENRKRRKTNLHTYKKSPALTKHNTVYAIVRIIKHTLANRYNHWLNGASKSGSR
ncbi:unnamed protein product [Notodromas monacha]|uniref:SET and MYND domain-containing protein 4 n=1 Tax=Notodromas monacha TaxID=399045 RepID=A0A7R9BLV7_9CRUS|nr:unnamed protein product [Notodromas monacha]CAG0917611.1 unnamed protein product [Notodromas monacha]